MKIIRDLKIYIYSSFQKHYDFISIYFFFPVSKYNWHCHWFILWLCLLKLYRTIYVKQSFCNLRENSNFIIAIILFYIYFKLYFNFIFFKLLNFIYSSNSNWYRDMQNFIYWQMYYFLNFLSTYLNTQRRVEGCVFSCLLIVSQDIITKFAFHRRFCAVERVNFEKQI